MTKRICALIILISSLNLAAQTNSVPGTNFSATEYLLNTNENIRWLVYPLAFVQGLGLIIMLNTATSLISDVIGTDSENAAFVYGAYSFFDKLANGSLLFFIVGAYSKGRPTELKWIMATIPIFCSACAYGLSFFGHKYFSHKLAKITGINQ